MRKDEAVEPASFLVCATKEHDSPLRPGPPDEHVWRAREHGIGKDFRLYLGSKALGKRAQEGRGYSLTRGEVRDFILAHLNLMQAGEGAVASTLDKGGFGKSNKFPIGSDVGVGL